MWAQHTKYLKLIKSIDHNTDIKIRKLNFNYQSCETRWIFWKTKQKETVILEISIRNAYL